MKFKFDINNKICVYVKVVIYIYLSRNVVSFHHTDINMFYFTEVLTVCLTVHRCPQIILITKHHNTPYLFKSKHDIDFYALMHLSSFL